MKICPNCKMTVDADCECPICHTTITYEPICDSDKEKYVFNKYFFLYLLKQCWFSVLCMIIVIITMLFTQEEFKLISLFPILFAVISLVESIFRRRITRYIQWKYSKEYSEYKTGETKIVSGIFAVVFAFVIQFI